MPISITWQFPRNLTNAPIGPRDRGIEHYTGNRLDSLVRETIQNSLDAQDKKLQAPVKVDFQITEMDTDLFNAPELATAIKASIAGLKSKDEAYIKMFCKAVTQLGNDTIPALVITDSNTTGVHDNKNDEACPWAALTRGSGESNKQGNNASGTKGIGKAAAHIATDLRTVLYTTTFKSNGHLESRFIGKSILSGHKNPQGEKVTSEGFLSGPQFASICNEDIPAAYHLGKPGLCLRIPGYRPPKDWQTQVIKVAVANFFHAIIKGELEITIGEQTVNAQTVNNYRNLLPLKEVHLLETSRKEPVAKTQITGVGDVNLRITLHDSSVDNVQDVALVRDAGMMITKVRTKLGPAQFSIPSHWRRFTAIAECISDPAGKSAVRDSESSKHDELAVGHIPNEEDRPQVRQALRQLGEWIKEEIRKHAEPASNTEPINATEAAELLPIKKQNNDPNRKPQVNGDNISVPVQRGTVAPTTRVRTPNPPDVDIFKPDKPRKPPKGTTPPAPQTVAQRDALARAKFRAGGRSDAHGLIIQIPPLTKRVDNVQIQAVTEHGNDVLLKISGAWSKGKALKVNKSKITAVMPNGKDPIILEVILLEAVAGRRFRLRTATEKGNSA